MGVRNRKRKSQNWNQWRAFVKEAKVRNGLQRPQKKKKNHVGVKYKVYYESPRCISEKAPSQCSPGLSEKYRCHGNLSIIRDPRELL
jgi:hypothetical protein